MTDHSLRVPSSAMTLPKALAVLALPIALALGLAAASLIYGLQADGSADAAQVRLQRALDRRPTEPVLQAAGLLVPGTTAGLAASALQAQVLALVTMADVQEIEALGAEAEGPLTRLRLNLRLTGAEASVMQALIALEQAQPLIFVDGLRLSGQGDGGALTAEVVLSAYAGKVAP